MPAPLVSRPIWTLLLKSSGSPTTTEGAEHRSAHRRQAADDHDRDDPQRLRGREVAGLAAAVSSPTSRPPASPAIHPPMPKAVSFTAVGRDTE